MGASNSSAALPQLSLEEERAGRAAYEGFYEEMGPWMPFPADWDGQADRVKRGWVAAAKAVQKLNR